ncbi:C2H2 transcription factor [Beauveria bassiana ARSEF 2860]|uniref:C2H2 transcription factor n=1 Tax=Beauveria bassiana (strain ARSEF 2860) TaxID=655819 RepID=J5JZS1_BEAB2|nr:C2H2 transcription factor [Beauveria bassiana ARSEF 2860]EJP67591.1 C2H2 transcription factor [Beauveria bassiana ARSEF 2860]
MSVAYEPRSFIHEQPYPLIGDDEHDPGADQRFTDSDVAEHLSHYTADASLLQDDRDLMDERALLHDPSDGPDGTRLDLGVADFSSPLEVPMSAPDMSPALPDSKDPSPSAESPTSSRITSIPKPSRTVSKQADGRFHCPLEDCKEAVRSFPRKCEWNKHMDKHERPYRCLAEGCEKLPGFTYPGGLSRHEREVHNKHGGPKHTVNCPHPNCKRYTGKGFSRQENLNEHLRRVHTSPDDASPLAATATAATAAVDSAAGSPDDNESERSGAKRKRRSSGERPSSSDEVAELRQEIKRVRMENEKLKQDMEKQARDSLTMVGQIAQLQNALSLGHSLSEHGLSAPTAQMI